MLDEIKKLTRTIQEKNIFEEVTFYLSREALIQKMQALSPHVAYEFIDASVEKRSAHLYFNCCRPKKTPL